MADPKNHQSSAVASATANVSQESLRSLTLLVAGLVPRLKAGARLLTWYGARFFWGLLGSRLRSKGGKSMTLDNTKQLHIASYSYHLAPDNTRGTCVSSAYPPWSPTHWLRNVFLLFKWYHQFVHIHYIQYIYILYTYTYIYIYIHIIYIYYIIYYIHIYIYTYIYIILYIFIYPVISSKNHLQVLGERLRQPLHLERWKWRDGRAGALAPYDERKLGEGVAKTVV